MQDFESRKSAIKGYLKRLNEGESLYSVRADFIKEFDSVEASVIMQAEQELIKEGTPLSEVQKLCDVHSALFHGATREEQIANAERAVKESLEKASKTDYSNKEEKARALAGILGHPLNTLTEENRALSKLIADFEEKAAKNIDITEEFNKIRDVSIHYAKKGDLLYPLLKVKYQTPGPSNVMWTVDDEIRDELTLCFKKSERDEAWLSRVSSVITRAKEMIYKEENILFPICAVNFSTEDWHNIYQDSKDYPPCFNVIRKEYKEAEAAYRTINPTIKDGEIKFPLGHMNLAQLNAVLNTIPLEITFIDDKNINRYFNEGPKVFKRPSMSLDRDVFSCHPPKVEPMVERIISDLRSGKKDEVAVWMEKLGRSFLVKYMAVRDSEKNYIGVMEVVQDMEFAKERFTK